MRFKFLEIVTPNSLYSSTTSRSWYLLSCSFLRKICWAVKVSHDYCQTLFLAQYENYLSFIELTDLVFLDTYNPNKKLFETVKSSFYLTQIWDFWFGKRYRYSALVRTIILKKNKNKKSQIKVQQHVSFDLVGMFLVDMN